MLAVVVEGTTRSSSCSTRRPRGFGFRARFMSALRRFDLGDTPRRLSQRIQNDIDDLLEVGKRGVLALAPNRGRLEEVCPRLHRRCLQGPGSLGSGRLSLPFVAGERIDRANGRGGNAWYRRGHVDPPRSCFLARAGNNISWADPSA